MAKKEYKTGTKKYYISNRKERDKQNNDYKRNHYRRFNLLIRNDEAEILEKLESVESKSQYIVDLIRKDIHGS